MFWFWDEHSVDNILMFLVVARQSRTFLLLILAWPARYMGSWEWTQLGQLTQTAQRGILCGMTLFSVYKLEELPGGQ